MLNFALKIALFLVCLCLPAQAQEVKVGTGLVCDTEAQVLAFISSKESPADKLTKINAEHPKACAVMTVMFLLGEKVPAPHPYVIHAIDLVAIYDGQTWTHIPAYPQFTFFLKPVQEV